MESEIQSYLKDEYLHIQKRIVEMDGRAVAIKTWSVSFGLACVVSAFVTKTHWVFLLSAGSICMFWLVEAFWKQFQFGFYGRSEAIERHFSGQAKLTAALQIDAYWREYWRGRSRGDLLKILIRPHVALPHAVILLFALVLFFAVQFGLLRMERNLSLEPRSDGTTSDLQGVQSNLPACIPDKK